MVLYCYLSAMLAWYRTLLAQADRALDQARKFGSGINVVNPPSLVKVSEKPAVPAAVRFFTVPKQTRSGVAHDLLRVALALVEGLVSDLIVVRLWWGPRVNRFRF